MYCYIDVQEKLKYDDLVKLELAHIAITHTKYENKINIVSCQQILTKSGMLLCVTASTCYDV